MHTLYCFRAHKWFTCISNSIEESHNFFGERKNTMTCGMNLRYHIIAFKHFHTHAHALLIACMCAKVLQASSHAHIIPYTVCINLYIYYGYKIINLLFVQSLEHNGVNARPFAFYVYVNNYDLQFNYC